MPKQNNLLDIFEVERWRYEYYGINGFKSSYVIGDQYNLYVPTSDESLETVIGIIFSDAFKKYEYKDRIVSVEIGGIGIVGPDSFEGCQNISNAIMDEGVKRIDLSAFKGCTALREIDIPDSLNKFYFFAPDSSPFLDCPNIRKVVFHAKTHPIDGLDSHLFSSDIVNLINFYVEKGNDALINQLKTFDVLDDHIVFAGSDFDISRDGLIVNVHNSAIKNGMLTIPQYYNGIEIEGLEKNVLSEYSGLLTSVTFADHSKASKISSDAFETGISSTTRFYVNEDDQELINNLKNVVGSDRVVIQGTSFNISDGTITKVKTNEPSVTIPRLYNGQKVTGIGSGAFNSCTEVKQIIFQKGSNVTTISHGAFDDIVSNNPLYYVDSSDKDKSLVQQLINAAVPTSNIILTGDDLDITKSGVIVDIHKTDKNKSITIPTNYYGEPITGIGSDAFSECGQVDNIIFSQDRDHPLTIDQKAFNKPGLTNTFCYVNQQNQNLTNQLEAAKVSDDHIVFGGDEFDITKSGLIHLVKENSETKSVTINPNIAGQMVRGIAANAFKNCQQIDKISFAQGSQATKIDPHAFDGLNAKYYVNSDDTNLIQSLKGKVGGDQNIIIQNNNFEINGGGTLLKLNSSDQNLVVNKDYAGVRVNGLGANVFHDDQHVKSIEFASEIKLNGSVDVNAFGGLVNHPILYTYNNDNVNALTNAAKGFEIGVSNDGGDFFTSFNDSTKFDGLTLRGRSQNELTLANNIALIGSNALANCSPALTKITINNKNVKFDADALNTGTIKSIIKNIKFYVFSLSVKKKLAENNVPITNIHLTIPPSPFIPPIPISKPVKKPTFLSWQNIGIIGGAVALAVIILGFSIGLPMRKQHKISMLQAKLNGRRIDKLSAANALAFKKVVEATGEIKKEMHLMSTDMKALKSASPAPAKPKVDTTGFKPTPKSPVKPADVKPVSSTSKPPVKSN